MSAKTKVKLPHHYTICSGWGNAINFTRPEEFEKEHDTSTEFAVHGHQRRIPEIGDLLAAEFQNSDRLFKFTEVKPCWNPPDMFFAKVKCIEARIKRPTP